MQTTTSADGVRIAYEARGEGAPVVVVGGAFSQASDGDGLADAFSEAGFRAITFDRRARGLSGDRRGSQPDDEVNDLAAVIDAAGGDAIVLGHSSGAVLALYAASRGVPMRALFLSEPPFRFGVDLPDSRLAQRLQEMVDAGDAAEAVAETLNAWVEAHDVQFDIDNADHFEAVLLGADVIAKEA